MFTPPAKRIVVLCKFAPAALSNLGENPEVTWDYKEVHWVKSKRI
jgi:hypothetical protein